MSEIIGFNQWGQPTTKKQRDPFPLSDRHFAMQRVDARDRQVWRLFQSGVKQTEIASRFNVSPTLVKNCIVKMLRHKRHMLVDADIAIQSVVVTLAALLEKQGEKE